MELTTKKAAFYTLGCKVNQYETEAMTELFSGAGYDIVPFDDTGVRSEYEKVAGILYGGQTIGTVVYKTNE